MLPSLNKENNLKNDQLTYSELLLEIMRQFVHSERWDQQVACLSYFENSSLNFRKMNIATIAAAFGSRQGLLVAFENDIATLSNARFVLHGRCTNYYIDAIVVILAVYHDLLEAVLQVRELVFDGCRRPVFKLLYREVVLGQRVCYIESPVILPVNRE